MAHQLAPELAVALLQHTPVPTLLYTLSSSASAAAQELFQPRWANAAASVPADKAHDRQQGKALLLETLDESSIQQLIAAFGRVLEAARKGASTYIADDVVIRSTTSRWKASFVLLPGSSASLQLLLLDELHPVIDSSSSPAGTEPDAPTPKESEPEAADAGAAPEPEPAAEATQKEEVKDAVVTTQELLDTFDWSRTSLGPRDQWPQSLTSMVSLMQGLEHETQLMWGPDYITIYNDAYAKMAGPKHPQIYGLPCGEAWPEIWSFMKPNADHVMGGNPIYRKQDQFFFTTGPGGSLEESHHLWMWTPVKVESGEYGGILSQSIEQTEKAIAERRLAILSHLSSGSVSAQSTKDLLKLLLDSLALEPHDIPFALVYDGNLSSSTSQSISINLVGAIGVPEGHAAAPADAEIVMDAADQAFPWPVAEALSTGAPVLVEDCKTLVDGFEVRSWELPSKALVVPVVDTTDTKSTRRLILVIGLNSRRPFDSSYKEWCRLLGNQVLAGLTSVMSIEAQLVRQEELAQLDRAKTTFFSNVSHELRTPLTLIQGPINDLLSEEADAKKLQMLNLSARNVKRLQRLVDMLMDVSRVEAGRMTCTFMPHQLGKFVADLASLFKAAIEKGGLAFVVDCDTSDNRPVYIDPDLFEKVIFNIVSNAYKYTLTGTITVSVRYGKDDVEVAVIDTGEGIPEADVGLVTDRFHRVASVSRSHEGTGIGLALTSDLIKLHRGQLLIESQTAAESADGRHGSTFRIVLRIGHAHLPPDQVEETPADSAREHAPSQSPPEADAGGNWTSYFNNLDGVSSPGTGTPSSVPTSSRQVGTPLSSLPPGPPTPTTSGLGATTPSETKGRGPYSANEFFWSRSDTILVVDDNADMRHYLKAILEKHVRVLEASDGAEALDLARKHQPDLVISDIMMPVLDGLGLLAALRTSEGEAAWIPVILITARSGEKEKVEGLMTGAEDYLVKPFSSKELVARAHLHLLMGKKRIDLERKFAARSEELRLRVIDAEERRQQADFERRQQELLVDVVSHETRNITSAISNLSLLCHDNLMALKTRIDSGIHSKFSLEVMEALGEEMDSLESVISLSASQERISNDILSLARIQRSALTLSPTEVDLVKVAQQSVAPFQTEASTSGIRLTFTLGETLKRIGGGNPILVRVDAVRLGQILTNLISNAMKFTTSVPVRQVEVSIELRKDAPVDDSCMPPPGTDEAFDTLGEAFIYGTVKDSGVGLSEESLKLLFQRFAQAATTTHSVFGGSGLGLFICRALCDVMDGRIEVESKLDEGSMFRFYVRTTRLETELLSPVEELGDPIPTPLPVEEVPATSSLTPSPVIPPPPALVEPPPPPPVERPKHVLIVEDNVINQKVLAKQLMKAGISCDIANHGREALDFLTAEEQDATKPRYTLVFMDLEMPVMGGIEATTHIREMEQDGTFSRRHVVIALTGNARQWQIERAHEIGMDAVVLKPYKFSDLLSRIDIASKAA